jgi:hypothetical protein
MSNHSKPCPRCGNLAKKIESAFHGNHVAHFTAHQLAHGHPLLALFAAGCWAGSKLIPTEYRCTSCGNEFRA